MHRAACSEKMTVRGEAALQLARAILRAGANIAATFIQMMAMQLQGYADNSTFYSLKIVDKSQQFR